MKRAVFGPALSMICTVSIGAQPMINPDRAPLALEFFAAYGARENLNNAVMALAEKSIAKDPSIPKGAIECLCGKKALDNLFAQSTEPILATFTDDELKYLIDCFKTTAFQKVFHPKPGDQIALTNQEQDALDRFKISPTGIKFTKEWPSVKSKMESIFRRWLGEAIASAQQFATGPTPH